MNKIKRNIQHKELYYSGRWAKMPFLEQMANIGSEVYRAISAKSNNRIEDAELAFIRSLELIDFTLECKLTSPQLKELCRLRELWVDFFKYDNEYKSDSKFFNDYFMWLTVYWKANL